MSLSPVEAQLLLCCTRVPGRGIKSTQMEALLHKTHNWQGVLNAAARHHVMPLLHQHVTTIADPFVPSDVREHLHLHYKSKAKRNLMLTRELLQLLALFEKHDIAAIPFKGPLLAISAYGDLALRTFSDLDILIHQRDCARARKLLLEQGYRESGYTPSGYGTFGRAVEESPPSDAMVFASPQNSFVLDLQWRIVSSRLSLPLDLSAMWERRCSVPLGGQEVETFAPEDMVLLLCIHGAKHLWCRLEWSCCLTRFINAHPQLDWGMLIENAGRLHVRRIILLGILLSAETGSPEDGDNTVQIRLGTLPTHLIEQARSDETVHRLATQVQQSIIASLCQVASTPSMEQWRRLKFHWHMRDRRRDKLCYGIQCVKWLLTPNAADRFALPLSTSLSGIYYLIRPFRLFVKHRRTTLSLLAKRKHTC
jgi:hypothetical protein